MKIPSYDDLAPSIADVHPRDTFDGAAAMVREREDPVVRAAPADHDSDDDAGAGLFACVCTAGAARPAALLALARDFSPRVERHGDTSIVLDVAGLGRLLGDAHGIASELARTARDRGLRVRLGVAPTQTAARLLGLSTDDQCVVTSGVPAALAPLPMTLLRTFTAEHPHSTRLFDILQRWGLRTIGELAALPADAIAARFGAAGVAIHRLARGIDPRPLVPDPGIRRFIESMELEWPIDTLEPLSFVLARLLDPLATALERADKGAAAVRLTLRLVDRTMHVRLLQLPAAMRDPRVLRTLLLLDLESHPPSGGIDVVTVEVDPAPGRIVQFSLLEHATPSPETVATLTARLSALVGEERCGSPVLLDSYRPDAVQMRRFAPQRSEGCPEGSPSSAGHGGARLACGSGCLRRFRPPVAVRITIERGRPAYVAIDRKGMPGGRVVQCAGPWRTSGAWWDAGHHWNRDEWDVELSDGSICRVYRDRETEVWFIEGVVD